ncbi:MAG: caspase family protein [Candidatus Obscuribacterales bacterium]|nr:caspase family protein [Candidatus Obscuribacterales bacterium]
MRLISTILCALLLSCYSVTAGLAQNPEASTATSTTPAIDTAKSKPVNDKWAIIVGVSKFGKSDIPQLKFAAKDARDFYDYLIKEANFKPDHVRLILDEKATRRRILSELDNMFLGRVARPDDLIVLFFSTHGSPAQLDKMGKNFIVAYDTEPNELFATGIEMQAMTKDLKERVDAQRVLLVLDACHSGGVSPASKGITRVGNFDTDTLSIGSGQMVICSSEPDQQSWESKRYDNGVFTRRLLEGLRAKGTATPVEDAFNSVNNLVQDEVRQDYPGQRQNPVMKSKWTGDGLILAVRPTDPRPIPSSVLEGLEPDSTSSVLDVVAPRSAPVAAQSKATQAAVPEVLKLNVAYFSNEPDPRKAYEYACQAFATHKSNPEFGFRKAKIQIQLGKWGSAMQELKGIIVDNPNVAGYYLARAYCFHKMKQEGNAQADLEAAIFKDVFLPKRIEFED